MYQEERDRFGDAWVDRMIRIKEWGKRWKAQTAWERRLGNIVSSLKRRPVGLAPVVKKRADRQDFKEALRVALANAASRAYRAMRSQWEITLTTKSRNWNKRIEHGRRANISTTIA